MPKPVISGGEEDLANLVLRLAISQMIAERAGQKFSLLILDEVFGSLDESRRHNVVELLRGLQDRFEQVILITHIESVREGLDRVISVRYDEDRGCSVVTRERRRDDWTRRRARARRVLAVRPRACACDGRVVQSARRERHDGDRAQLATGVGVGDAGARQRARDSCAQ